MKTIARTMLDAALAYAERDVPIFPCWWIADRHCACGRGPNCKDSGKHPLGDVAPNGLKDAATEIARITAWWRRHPHAHIATPTTWCAVLDVDPRHGGNGALAALERHHGALPVTPQVWTGGGGAHHYFQPVPHLRCSSGVVGAGLDIRAQGGYVLVPPSGHVSGGVYHDDPDRPLFETDLAPMPSWLVDLALATSSSLSNGTGPRATPDAWAERLRGAPEGRRRAVALEIAGHYLGLHIVTTEVEAILLGYAARCVPPFPEGEVREIVRDLAAKDARKPPGERAKPGVPLRPGGRAAILVPASSVTPKPITWVDPGRLAVGALTMGVGLPDQGKTLVACDYMARLSVGSPLPPAAAVAGRGASRRSLMLTNEDTLASTIVPRLSQAGADLTKISFVQMVRDADGALSLLTLERDIDALEHAIETEHPALVVVDGIIGYLGNVKSHNDADVRRVLTPFATLLARTGAAGIGLMHPPKVTTNLHYYAGGSVAFTAVPRVVLGVAQDPDDDSANPRRFLVKLKGNLYGRVPTLAYRIVAADDAAVPWITWEAQPVTVNLTDIFTPPQESPEDRGSRRQCEAWLREYLVAGPRHSEDVMKDAAAAGFTKITLRRARERVCDSVKKGVRWEWLLTPESPA